MREIPRGWRGDGYQPINDDQDDFVEVELGKTANETLHLLSCTQKGRYAVALHQNLVTDITDDRKLFQMLRDSYFKQRGDLRPYWALKTLQGIHFVKVC